MKKIRIRLKRSPIGAKPKLRKTVTALGLRRVNASVVVEATPAVEGMVRAVSHMLEVSEVEGAAATAGARSGAQRKAAFAKTGGAKKRTASDAPRSDAPRSDAPAGKPKE